MNKRKYRKQIILNLPVQDLSKTLKTKCTSFVLAYEAKNIIRIMRSFGGKVTKNLVSDRNSALPDNTSESGQNLRMTLKKWWHRQRQGFQLCSGRGYRRKQPEMTSCEESMTKSDNDADPIPMMIKDLIRNDFLSISRFQMMTVLYWEYIHRYGDLHKIRMNPSLFFTTIVFFKTCVGRGDGHCQSGGGTSK